MDSGHKRQKLNLLHPGLHFTSKSTLAVISAHFTARAADLACYCVGNLSVHPGN
ncbi:hypothetical protein B0T18DRAFT_403763 [Schizothecium vesticola]|uniref:Uncharacterized protein n=1 Tax=Schizothecium vesticola TaxID=314040 RepID=A0AA40F6L6_9PEZI|nr:hypothetical protein B0T18DRAFT_403763 [Schizothecium vesticola]